VLHSTVGKTDDSNKFNSSYCGIGAISIIREMSVNIIAATNTGNSRRTVVSNATAGK
jgi:hypothetical protein